MTQTPTHLQQYRTSDEESIVEEVTIISNPSELDSGKNEKFNSSSPDSPTSDQNTPQHLASVGPPPNGGLTAWLQVLAGFLLFFNSWGIVNAFGEFQTYYQANLLSSSTSSAISWIGSIQGFLVIDFSVVLGPLVDKGHGKTMVFIGSVVLTFGLMMTSLGKEYYQLLLAQGIVVGLGCSTAFVSSVAIISSYFSTKKAFAMGLCAAGSSVGGLIFPILVHRLIPRIGFPWTIRVIGFIALATTMFAASMLKIRLPPKKTVTMIHLPSLKDPKLMIFSVAMFFGFTGLYIPFFYIQTYGLSHYMDSDLAFYLISILNSASVFGRIIPNFLADHVGPYNVLIICTFASTVLIFCWIRITSSAGLIVFAALYGFSSGAFVSIPPACVNRISPDITLIGSRLGLSFFICGFGLLMGTPVAGAILKLQNPIETAKFIGDQQVGMTFWGIQIFSGLCMFICFVLCLVSKIMVGEGHFFRKT